MRFARVAIIGPPNSGKSTLVNRLVGCKVSIVSRRPQTTRENIVGLGTVGDCQLAFVDTPGAKRGLGRDLLQRQVAASRGADIVAVLLDAKLPAEVLIEQTAALRNFIVDKRCLGVLNKIDIVNKGRLLRLTEAVREAFEDRIFYVSALTGDGVDDLLSALTAEAKEGPWRYDADLNTTGGIVERLEEALREAVFHQTGDELPYLCKTEVNEIAVRAEGRKFVRLTIEAANRRHQGMIVGKGGERIKRIRRHFLKGAQDILGCRCRAAIEIKVRK